MLECLEGEAFLHPLSLFEVRFDIFYAERKELGQQHLLPTFPDLWQHPPFAQCFLGWHEEGIALRFSLPPSFQQARFPAFLEGDAVEIWIETRVQKEKGYTTRFSHHFFFLPQVVCTEEMEIQKGEITRFRTEDKHPLCPAERLHLTVDRDKKKTEMYIFISTECLCGYDPLEVGCIGFTYRISRKGGSSQCFSVEDTDFPLEQLPAVWATGALIR